MDVRLARLEEVGTYAALGRVAQAWLQTCGLGQYVPSAHAEYAGAIHARVESGTLVPIAIAEVT